jgi:hypothetical protein
MRTDRGQDQVDWWESDPGLLPRRLIEDHAVAGGAERLGGGDVAAGEVPPGGVGGDADRVPAGTDGFGDDDPGAAVRVVHRAAGPAVDGDGVRGDRR